MADAMEGQIQEGIKAQRSDILLNIEKDLEKTYQKNFIGKKENVLFEEITDIQGNEYLVGYNERYVRIAVLVTEKEAAQALCNTIGVVEVTGNLTDEILLGEYKEA